MFPMSLNVTVMNVYLSVLSDSLQIGFINWNLNNKSYLFALRIYSSFFNSEKIILPLNNAVIVIKIFAIGINKNAGTIMRV